MLHLSRRQEPPDEHQRRQPLEGQRDRRGLVPEDCAGKLRTGEIKTEKTFREASEQFLREYDIITQGQRSKVYVDGQHWRSRVHLVPFFGDMGLSEITPGQSRNTASTAAKKR